MPGGNRGGPRGTEPSGRAWSELGGPDRLWGEQQETSDQTREEMGLGGARTMGMLGWGDSKVIKRLWAQL